MFNKSWNKSMPRLFIRTEYALKTMRMEWENEDNQVIEEGNVEEHIEQNASDEIIVERLSSRTINVATNNQINLTEDLENWMGNLPIELHKIPLIHLAIPGSHDSGTYAINKHSPIAPDAEKFIEKLRWTGIFIRWVVSRWSKTQEHDITEQLKGGIRFFDLRIAPKPTDGFHIVHGLYSTKVIGVLNQVNDFLTEHNREVVILDCQHFYAMKEEDHESLVEIFHTIFGKKIVPCENNYIKHITLDYMLTNRYQVLIIYRTKDWRKFQLFPNSSYPTPWPNTPCSKTLIQFLSTRLQQRNYNFGYVTQFILTPTASSIFKHLSGNVKTFSAETLYRKKMDWIRQQKAGEGGVNVIIGDFIDLQDSRFAQIVINLNSKLIDDIKTANQELPPVTV